MDVYETEMLMLPLTTDALVHSTRTVRLSLKATPCREKGVSHETCLTAVGSRTVLTYLRKQKFARRTARRLDRRADLLFELTDCQGNIRRV